MTVIAWDGKTLASDSQATTGGVAEFGFKKIFVAPEDERWSIYDKRILCFAFSGEYAAYPEIIENLKKGIGFDTKGKMDAWGSILAFSEDKHMFVLRHYGEDRNNLWEMIPIGYKQTLGCGGDYATAYMAAGSDAASAVKKTIKIDIHCGGDVQTWEYPEVIEPVKEKEGKPSIPPEQQKLINETFAAMLKSSQEATEKAMGDLSALIKRKYAEDNNLPAPAADTATTLDK